LAQLGINLVIKRNQ